MFVQARVCIYLLSSLYLSNAAAGVNLYSNVMMKKKQQTCLIGWRIAFLTRFFFSFFPVTD